MCPTNKYSIRHVRNGLRTLCDRVSMLVKVFSKDLSRNQHAELVSVVKPESICIIFLLEMFFHSRPFVYGYWWHFLDQISSGSGAPKVWGCI